MKRSVFAHSPGTFFTSTTGVATGTTGAFLARIGTGFFTARSAAQRGPGQGSRFFFRWSGAAQQLQQSRKHGPPGGRAGCRLLQHRYRATGLLAKCITLR